MKLLNIVLILIGLIGLAGCEKKSEPGTTTAPGSSAQAATDAKQSGQTAVAEATEQTTCPIMTGRPINKELFVEYKGKKVYFCCKGCIEEFNKDPEKYVKDLPQFKQ